MATPKTSLFRGSRFARIRRYGSSYGVVDSEEKTGLFIEHAKTSIMSLKRTIWLSSKGSSHLSVSQK